MPIRHGDNILRVLRFLQQGRNEHCGAVTRAGGPRPYGCSSLFAHAGQFCFLGLEDLSPMIFYSAFLLNNV